jgi:dihydrofolate reductase
MAYWDAPVEGYPPEHRDFARVWQKGEKIVFSRTLTGGRTRNTRVERDFDLEAVRKLKRESEHDISIGGAELAGLALEADLVDECHLFLNPVIVGGGKPAFRAALRRNLELLETRRFGTGVILLRYRIRGGTPYGSRRSGRSAAGRGAAIDRKVKTQNSKVKRTPPAARFLNVPRGCRKQNHAICATARSSSRAKSSPSA